MAGISPIYSSLGALNALKPNFKGKPDGAQGSAALSPLQQSLNAINTLLGADSSGSADPISTLLGGGSSGSNNVSGGLFGGSKPKTNPLLAAVNNLVATSIESALKETLKNAETKAAFDSKLTNSPLDDIINKYHAIQNQDYSKPKPVSIVA